MARPFEFPDVKDRTINEPMFCVSQTQLLGNYNQANTNTPPVLQVTDDVKLWFQNEAYRLGWSKVEFHANQCVLTASLELVTS